MPEICGFHYDIINGLAEFPEQKVNGINHVAFTVTSSDMVSFDNEKTLWTWRGNQFIIPRILSNGITPCENFKDLRERCDVCSNPFEEGNHTECAKVLQKWKDESDY